MNEKLTGTAFRSVKFCCHSIQASTRKGAGETSSGHAHVSCVTLTSAWPCTRQDRAKLEAEMWPSFQSSSVQQPPGPSFLIKYVMIKAVTFCFVYSAVQLQRLMCALQCYCYKTSKAVSFLLTTCARLPNFYQRSSLSEAVPLSESGLQARHGFKANMRRFSRITSSLGPTH